MRWQALAEGEERHYRVMGSWSRHVIDFDQWEHAKI